MQIVEYSGEELEDVAGEFFLPVIVQTVPNSTGGSRSRNWAGP
ncbi:hypothetical protein [Pseudonocardia alaniniphila]|nr:hypothetical protein [Pseudonocardia alaniniphila]